MNTGTAYIKRAISMAMKRNRANQNLSRLRIQISSHMTAGVIRLRDCISTIKREIKIIKTLQDYS